MCEDIVLYADKANMTHKNDKSRGKVRPSKMKESGVVVKSKFGAKKDSCDGILCDIEMLNV